MLSAAAPPRKSFLYRLNHAEEYLGVALLVVLGVMLSAQVIMRFGFGLGYSWIEEITRMLFIWVIFLGAVAAMRRNLHIRVEAGLLLFPPRLRALAGWIGDLALFAFCLAMTWTGIELAASTLDANFRLQSTGVSMFWPYTIIASSPALLTGMLRA